MGRTSIEWTQTQHADGTTTPGYSWPVVNGCRRVSPGCGGGTEGTNKGGCYAERLIATRLSQTPKYAGLSVFGPNGPRWTGESRLWAKSLSEPFKIREPSKIFVADMGDLFFEEVSNEDIAAVFGIMAACPQHVFQVLSKRTKRMLEWCRWIEREEGARRIGLLLHHAQRLCDHKALRQTQPIFEQPWPLRNVWMGASVEDQQRADERVPILAHVPAAIRFLSYEPALGPLDLHIELDATSSRFGLLTCPQCRGWGGSLTSLVPDINGNERMKACGHCDSSGCAISWIICGGESGPGARPFSLEWARDIVRQCKEAQVACFVKQLGSNPAGHVDDAANYGPVIRLKDRKGGDMSEWEPGLRVREFPEVAS